MATMPMQAYCRAVEDAVQRELRDRGTLLAALGLEVSNSSLKRRRQPMLEIRLADGRRWRRPVVGFRLDRNSVPHPIEVASDLVLELIADLGTAAPDPQRDESSDDLGDTIGEQYVRVMARLDASQHVDDTDQR